MSASSDQVITANIMSDVAIAETTPGEIVLVQKKETAKLESGLPTHLLFALIVFVPAIFLGAIAIFLLAKTTVSLLRLLSAPKSSPTVAAAYRQISQLD
ncbi:MAG: hypothetical protein WBB82_04080 [Limnothrix sp.]